MGHHNNIHESNDDHFYYCTLHDCSCGRRIDYYDTSNNYESDPTNNRRNNPRVSNDRIADDNKHPTTSIQ
jgi:hypothetical protein